MLFMYRRKSVGEMTPPCGTRSLILMLSLMYASSLTLADLSCRKHRIHLYILPDIRLWNTFSRRPSHHTLSNAFVRSKKTATTFFFSWNAFSISWTIRASWCSVLLCFLYPVCVCDRTVLYFYKLQHCFETSQQRIWTEVLQKSTKAAPDTSDKANETVLCQMSSPLDSRWVEESVVFWRIHHATVCTSPHAN